MATADGLVHSVDPSVRTMARFPILPPTGSGSSFEVSFIDETGTQRREPLPSCWNLPFERARPSRSFPSFKGQRNFPGLWWSATTGEHVGYESWVERDVAMLLDFDPEIVAFSSQPFWLIWPGQQSERRHAPDFFARRADGTGVVIDVRPGDLVDPKAAEVLDVTASACREAGWEVCHTDGPAAIQAANVRWLAGYRHPRCRRPEIAAALVERFGEPMPLYAGAAAVGDRLAVLPVLYHLLWRHELTTDLAAAPLSPASLVCAAEETPR
jgi:hypothetical protein